LDGIFGLQLLDEEFIYVFAVWIKPGSVVEMNTL
jgi:hypothetical protein